MRPLCRNPPPLQSLAFLTVLQARMWLVPTQSPHPLPDNVAPPKLYAQCGGLHARSILTGSQRLLTLGPQVAIVTKWLEVLFDCVCS